MKNGLAILTIVLLAGCVRFHPQPLPPSQTADEFDARSLTNAGLAAFLAANQVAEPGPQRAWDLNALTLVAFYYHPDLPVARAQWAAARAGEITAGQRPNPSVAVTPGYDIGIPDNPSPWLVPLTFDVPIETAGKRRRRTEQARHLAEAARWNLVGTAWQVRSRVRSSLLNLYAARETRSLLARQEAAQTNVVRLLEAQVEAGNVSGFEVTQARIALATTQLALQAAFRQLVLARVQLANAIGLPVRALDRVPFSFTGLDAFPRELTAPGVRRQALLDRSDVRGALAEYAASQSALQLEIARQYPDLHLGPGYTWNAGSAGDSQWSLGLGLTLPVLNQNQGPVAEAKARREEAAAHFLAVQAQAIGAVDGALAGYRAARQQSATAAALLDNLQKRMRSVRAMQQAGELDSLAVASADVEYNTGALSRLDAVVKAQEALGQLEDAVQNPLTLPEALLRNTEKNPRPINPSSQHEP
ncbi:MAG: TolC family protein [Limisphaerales bacterium]